MLKPYKAVNPREDELQFIKLREAEDNMITIYKREIENEL